MQPNDCRRDDNHQRRYSLQPNQWSTSTCNRLAMEYPHHYNFTQLPLNTELNPIAQASLPINPPPSHFSTSAFAVGEAPCENIPSSANLIRPTTGQRDNSNLAPAESPGHPMTSTICDYPNCGQIFSRSYDIKRHKSSVHGDGLRFHCPLVGCSHQDGFPRKDKLKDHLRQKHKMPEDKASILLQKVNFSDGSPGILADTLLAHETAYTPGIYTLGSPSSLEAGMSSQVTNNHHAHPNILNIGFRRPANQIAPQASQGGCVVRANPPVTAALAPEKLAHPLSSSQQIMVIQTQRPGPQAASPHSTPPVVGLPPNRLPRRLVADTAGTSLSEKAYGTKPAAPFTPMQQSGYLVRPAPSQPVLAGRFPTKQIYSSTLNQQELLGERYGMGWDCDTTQKQGGSMNMGNW